MPTKTEVRALICIESFVAFYDDEGTRQFVGRKDRTIIAPDSLEAKRWGKFFEPVSPEILSLRQDIYPVEQATAAPGERRD